MKKIIPGHYWDQQGLSLVEVLVSLLLLFLLVNYMLTVFTFSLTTNNQARLITTANIYAVSILEEIRGNLDSIVLEEWVGTKASPADMGLICSGDNNLDVEISVSTAGMADLYQVQVRVIWQNMGRDYDCTLASILADEAGDPGENKEKE